MGIDKFLVVFCHSRGKLLDKCLKSISAARGRSSWKILVIHQVGFMSVEKILMKYKNLYDYKLSLKPNYDFPLGNINYNRYLGTDFAFTTLGAKLVLGIEEDNLVSKDSLEFIEYAYEKYKSHKAFRGVNLGSIEHGNGINLNEYSLLRFGIHGSAGALTKRSWNYIKRNRVLDFDYNEKSKAWDAEIEFYLKSGFMVTPNLSRNLDLGYGGTFAPSSKKDTYFVNIAKSWVKNGNNQTLHYKHNQIRHDWRFDSIAYKKRENYIFFIRRYGRLDRLSSFLNIKSILKKYIYSRGNSINS